MIVHLTLVEQFVGETGFHEERCLTGANHLWGEYAHRVGRHAGVVGDGSGDVAPQRVAVLLHLQASGLAHRREDVRLDGALECPDLDNLHLHAHIVEQSLEERGHAAHAVDVNRSDGVEVELVGGGGYQIVALSVGVAIGHHPFA